MLLITGLFLHWGIIREKFIYLDFLLTFEYFVFIQTKKKSIFPHSPVFPLSPDDDCRLSDYRRLKTKTLDLHDKRYTGSRLHGAHKDNMAARKQLVDMMFKRFDADSNGQIESSELSQVRTQRDSERLKQSVG